MTHNELTNILARCESEALDRAAPDNANSPEEAKVWHAIADLISKAILKADAIGPCLTFEA